MGRPRCVARGCLGRGAVSAGLSAGARRRAVRGGFVDDGGAWNH